MTFLPTTGPSRPIVSLDLSPDLEIREPILTALAAMRTRNPILRVTFDNDAGSIRVADNSESKLRDICRDLEQHIGHPIEAGPLHVVCVETIRSSAEAEGKYIRQTGGSGNYGHVRIRLEPSEPGKAFQFINQIRGGVVPEQYIDPIRIGIQEAALGGVLAGCELVDWNATLYDGSYHELDSNDIAFQIAASMAFKEAAKKALPVLLEPVMAIEIAAPEQYTGTIIRDLNTRRGRIENIELQQSLQLIHALAPLRQMLGYPDELRSLTEGRATCLMEFLRYEPAPDTGYPGGDEAGFPVTRPHGPAPRATSVAIDLDLDGT